MGNGATLAVARDLNGHVAALLLEAAAHWGQSSGSLSADLHFDLPSYAPGEAINFRALIHPAGILPATPVADQSIDAELLNPAGALIASLTLKPDSVGGIGGLFSLARDALPGTYLLRITSGGAHRDFSIPVEAAHNDGLSVSFAPGLLETSSTEVTGTVSLLDPRGDPVFGIVTATLRMQGDTWASRPVTATALAGEAIFTLPLPAWASIATDVGLFVEVEGRSGQLTGRVLHYLEPQPSQMVTLHVMSPSLNLDVKTGSREEAPELHVSTLSDNGTAGPVMLLAVSPYGEHLARIVEPLSGEELTVKLPQIFAGGRVLMLRAGVPGHRELDLLSTLSHTIGLQLSAPGIVAAGAPFSLTVALHDGQEHAVPGTASLWLRRAWNDQAPGAIWEPSLSIGPQGSATYTESAPLQPGFWYLMSEAVTESGGYARSWSLLRVTDGPTLQLPEASQGVVAQVQSISVAVYNPTEMPLVTSLRAEAEGNLTLVGAGSQNVDLPAHARGRFAWQYVLQQSGDAAIHFSFVHGAMVSGQWTLPITALPNLRTAFTYASGVSTGERTIGVLVPSGIPAAGLQLHVHASSSLLSSLATAGTEITSIDGPSAAARLSASSSVISITNRLGMSSPVEASLSQVERSLLLQEIYSTQLPDGGWPGTEGDTSHSSITATAGLLSDLARYASSTKGLSPPLVPAVSNHVVERGLNYLLWEGSRPAGSADVDADQLDNSVYALYVLSIYNRISADMVRPYLVYTTRYAEHRLSTLSQARLALALRQLGDKENALALAERCCLDGPYAPTVELSSALLELSLVVVSLDGVGNMPTAHADLYKVAARDAAHTLFDARHGLGWSDPQATSEAVSSLALYAFFEHEIPGAVPQAMLDNRLLSVSTPPPGSDSLSLEVGADTLHPGTNWLKLSTSAPNQPFYYSLTLQATK